MKINLGCGPCHLPGWTNVDIRKDTDWKIDKHWDFTERLPVEDGSVDVLLSWHILEHIELNKRGGVLKDWHRVLKQDGKLIVAVPDLLYLTEMYRAGALGEDPWFQLMASVYGPYNGSDGDYHRWGYHYGELERVLKEEGGFAKVEKFGETGEPQEIAGFTRGDGFNRKVVLAPWAAQCVATK